MLCINSSLMLNMENMLYVDVSLNQECKQVKA